jgi:uncharacterized membrane protein (DUF2068 family)
MESSGMGWKVFAGTCLLIVGTLNVFDGLVAITQSQYIARNTRGELPITNNIETWGWVALVLGVIVVLAGVGVVIGATWARVVGVVVASLNLVFQFAFMGHFPFWSFTVIVIDLLVIYGLVAHGGRVDRHEAT